MLATWSNRNVIDEAWRPFEFELASERVIEGFDRGVTGMRLGGRRELIIPLALAYGEQGSGPVAPNETLFFVVDLVAVARRRGVRTASSEDGAVRASDRLAARAAAGRETVKVRAGGQVQMSRSAQHPFLSES